jgi:hypothetical protein
VEPAAEIAGVKIRRRIDRAGEEAPAERAEGYEPDPEFLERRQQFLLGLAPPEEYSLCSAVTGWTACARRIVATPASDIRNASPCRPGSVP